MFLLLLHYKQPLEIIDQHLAAHREFLETEYQKDHFVVSGPRNPRTGGILISQLKDKAELEKILAQDPFVIHDVAHYEVIEFMPVKYHSQFSTFV